jgi:hypothetical protein
VHTKTSQLNTYYGNARATTSREVGAKYPDRKTLGNNKEEAKMVIKYLKKKSDSYTIFRIEVQTTKSDTHRRTKKNGRHARMTR